MSASAQILVVDDDRRICNLLSRYLKREGYRVDTAGDGESMRRHLQNFDPDLLILDLVLPDEDGLSLAREVRSERDIGIIILTGKGETVDKVVGLELGADDYISKPFNERELLARIRSVLRRTAKDEKGTGMKAEHSLARFDNWQLDFNSNELMSIDGENVYLTSFEYSILAEFVKQPNRVFSRDQVLKLLKGSSWVSSDRSVDVLIGKLRKKLNDNADHPRLIKTVRGVGYKFTSEVEYS